MLIRLLVQLFSFKKIISKAQLVSDNDVKLYQVNQPIIPFSFGNSIFINQQLHSDEELTEIIRHEFVHVKQKHTADIIWCELLCITNWYNPFAWMIRKTIRQNLEFIADNKVLQSGIDRKEYQYLLLKVIGNNHFSIASQFNFSSLKKRIAMMNRTKSSNLHFIKFLFILPVVMILLLAFRTNKISADHTLSHKYISPGTVDTVPRNKGLMTIGDIPDSVLWILNDKKMTKEEIEKLDPSAIESIQVWKGDSVIKRYKEKGKHGVIKITLKREIRKK